MALLTVVVTIEVSIVCTYVQLCAEDYLWWWRSFHRGGSIALYVMLYSSESSGGVPSPPFLPVTGPLPAPGACGACPPPARPDLPRLPAGLRLPLVVHALPRRPRTLSLCPPLHMCSPSPPALPLPPLPAVGFLVNTLHNLSGAVPMLLYVSYMGLVTWGIFLAMGTIGFLSSYLFTYSIFASVRTDKPRPTRRRCCLRAACACCVCSSC